MKKTTSLSFGTGFSPPHKPHQTYTISPPGYILLFLKSLKDLVTQEVTTGYFHICLDFWLPLERPETTLVYFVSLGSSVFEFLVLTMRCLQWRVPIAVHRKTWLFNDDYTKAQFCLWCKIWECTNHPEEQWCLFIAHIICFMLNSTYDIQMFELSFCCN